jgi:hypothetical protein
MRAVVLTINWRTEKTTDSLTVDLARDCDLHSPYPLPIRRDGLESPSGDPPAPHQSIVRATNSGSWHGKVDTRWPTDLHVSMHAPHRVAGKISVGRAVELAGLSGIAYSRCSACFPCTARKCRNMNYLCTCNTSATMASRSQAQFESQVSRTHVCMQWEHACVHVSDPHRRYSHHCLPHKRRHGACRVCECRSCAPRHVFEVTVSGTQLRPTRFRAIARGKSCYALLQGRS